MQTLPSLINAHPTVLVLLQNTTPTNIGGRRQLGHYPGDTQAISGDVLAYRGICG